MSAVPVAVRRTVRRVRVKEIRPGSRSAAWAAWAIRVLIAWWTISQAQISWWTRSGGTVASGDYQVVQAGLMRRRRLGSLVGKSRRLRLYHSDS